MLLHEQVPGVDLVDHNDLHGDAIRQHELYRGEGAAVTETIPLISSLNKSRGPRASLWAGTPLKRATRDNMAPRRQRLKDYLNNRKCATPCGCCPARPRAAIRDSLTSGPGREGPTDTGQPRSNCGGSAGPCIGLGRVHLPAVPSLPLPLMNL